MKTISALLLCLCATSGIAQFFYVPDIENITLHDFANFSREDTGVIEKITDGLTKREFVQTTVALDKVGVSAFVTNYSTFRVDSFEEIRNCFKSKQGGCVDIVSTSPELLGKGTVRIIKILRAAPLGNVLRCHIPPNDDKNSSVQSYCHTDGIYTGYRSGGSRGYKSYRSGDDLRSYKGYRSGENLRGYKAFHNGTTFLNGVVIYADAQAEDSSSTLKVLMACHGFKAPSCHLLLGSSFVAFNTKYPEFPNAVAVRVPLDQASLKRFHRTGVFTKLRIYY